jgi:hypothetical protein
VTWFASSANQSEAAKDHYMPFLATSFDFVGGFKRMWTGTGDVEIGGNIYAGVGHFARIRSVVERSNMTVERKVYQLAGDEVNPALIAEADIDASYGRTVIEYLGFLNPETRKLLDTPEINFEGEISNVRRADGGEPMVEINAETRLVILDKPDGWRWTHQHQQSFYSDDLGFNKVAEMQLREIIWGDRAVGRGIFGTVLERIRQGRTPR